MGSTKKNFIYNLILGGTNILVPVVTFPYASRVLGPEGIGITSFALSLSVTFIVLGSLGIPIYGIREIAKSRKSQHELSKTFSELIIIHLFWIILVLVFYAAWIFLSGTYQNEIQLKYFSFAHIICSVGLINWFYQGIERYKWISIINAISKALIIILLFILVNSPNDYWIYYSIIVFSNILTAVLNIFYSFNYVRFTLSGLNYKRHLKPIIVLFSTQLAISIYVNLDIIMLNYLSNIEQVGYYSTALKIVKTVLIIVTSLGAVLIPKISLLIKEKRKEDVRAIIEKSIKFVFITSFPLMIGLTLVSNEIIILFAGIQFISASSILIWLTPLIFLAGMSNVFGLQVLVPCNLEKKLMYVVVFAAFMNFSLNLFLIPIYQIKGAVFSTIITEIIIVSFTFILSKKELAFKFPIKQMLLYFALSLLFIPLSTLISFYLGGLPYIITSTAICSLIYFVSLFTLKERFFIENIYNPILYKLNL